MPDSLRDSDTPDVPPVSRDSQIEDLLLTGLDHYFSGQHELAISIWTRVLFLDRNHARARAYIERARGAIAERQREAEELLQTGVAAFQRGDAADAQRLLSTAVERGVRPEEPLALLERLARLAPADQRGVHADPHTHRSPQRPAASARSADAGVPRGSRAVGFMFVLAIGLVAGALFVLYATTGGLNWPAPALSPADTHVRPVPDPLPVPGGADLALARAQALAAGGHPREALRALDEIRPGDPLRRQADQLRADIQQRLLAAAHAGAASAAAAR